MVNKSVPIQIKIALEEKDRWQTLAEENGFISIPTMVRFLIVQFERKNRKYVTDVNMLEDLILAEKVKLGEGEVFTGDLDELAAKYGN